MSRSASLSSAATQSSVGGKVENEARVTVSHERYTQIVPPRAEAEQCMPKERLHAFWQMLGDVGEDADEEA